MHFLYVQFSQVQLAVTLTLLLLKCDMFDEGCKEFISRLHIPTHTWTDERTEPRQRYSIPSVNGF